MYAHTQTFLPKDHGRSIVQPRHPTTAPKSIHINSAFGGSPRTLAHMLDSLVRVSRRVDKRHFVRVPHTHDGKLAYTSPETSPTHARKPNSLRLQVTTGNTASHRFLFSNFRYSFTLFSKFFASFPHGTCSLSVYHQYLALDGIYHPLRAAIPNNSTRRKLKTLVQAGMNGAITLLGALFQETWPAAPN